jgi:hypothetical protein
LRRLYPELEALAVWEEKMATEAQIQTEVRKRDFRADFTDHYVQLLSEHEQSGLAPPHFLSELQTGETVKFWAAVWEAMLFRHFRDLGCDLVVPPAASRSGQNGPDLGISLRGGRTLWIEATIATTGGSAVLRAFAEPAPGVVRDVPSTEMLLRVTNSISIKTDRYVCSLQENKLDVADPYFVAINTMMLSTHWGYDKGISQLPLVVEAVSAVGPLIAEIDRSTGRIRDIAPSLRDKIFKSNGSDVGTWTFSEGVSPLAGVIGCNRDHMLDTKLYGSVAFNCNDSAGGRPVSELGEKFWGTLDGFSIRGLPNETPKIIPLWRC